MAKSLLDFQHYQQAFSAYIRAPSNHALPTGVPAERMAVYEEIVFTNIFEVVSACFPVAQKVLGKRAWLTLVQAFLREHSANSPIFRKVPEEFLSFLASHINDKAPAYLLDLCHYEWVELSVSSIESHLDMSKINPTGDLLAGIAVFNPAMQLLQYQYSVHKISPRFKPKQPENTQLLVYRNQEDLVSFIELNAVTYRLVELLHQENMTGQQALEKIAIELQHPHTESVIQFGLEILETLRKQEVIFGVLEQTK